MASILDKLPFNKLPFLKRKPVPSDTEEEKEMTIFGHLAELRDRLIWAVGSLLITTVISFFFAESVIRILMQPGGEQLQLRGLQLLNPTEGFTTLMQVSIMCGFVMALPIISWQIVAYISPGLYPHEKRILYILLPGITFCFLIGASFAFFVMLPVALTFLYGIGKTVFQPDWQAASYIETVTQLMFWTGIVFQTPLLLYVASRLKLVTTAQLVRYRKYAFLISFVIGSIITPTADPVNMSLVALPVYLLYELGVLLTQPFTLRRVLIPLLIVALVIAGVFYADQIGLINLPNLNIPNFSIPATAPAPISTPLVPSPTVK